MPSDPRSRLVRAICLALAVAGTMMVACAEDLPDAPDPGRPRHTPFPFEPEPDPAASGFPMPTPSPTGTRLPDAPRDGQLVRTGGGYLEFLPTTQNGKLVFLFFPYDSRLAGIGGSASEASGTLAIDGGSNVFMSPYTDAGEIFFYYYPRIAAGSHNVAVSAKVKGIDYSGTFTYP